MALLMLLLLAYPAEPRTPQQVSKPAPAAVDPAERHYHAAQTFQLTGDFDKAVAEYREAIGRGLQSLGNLRVAQGKVADGIELLESATQLQPQNVDASLDLAIANYYARDLARSRLILEELLKRDPSNRQAVNLLGKIELIQGDFSSAAGHLQAALSAQPDFDVAYSLAIADLKQKKAVEARTVFDDMQSSLGPTAQLHSLIGMAYRETGYLEEAAAHFTKAISLDARHPHAHAALGMTYLLQGPAKYPEAQHEFEAELAIDPRDQSSHYFIGMIRLGEHKPAKAAEELAEAVRLKADDPNALFNLGNAYFESGAFEKAAGAFRKSIALLSAGSDAAQLSEAHAKLAEALQRLGRNTESAAETALAKRTSSREKSSAPRPGDASLSEEAGRSNEQELRGMMMRRADVGKDDPKEAEYVKTVSKLLGDAYHNLGVIDARASRYAEAAGEFRQAARWDPKIEALDRNWGVAAFRAKLYSDAVVPLARLLRRTPADLTIREMLGLSYFMTDRFAESAEVLGPVASKLPDDPGLLYAAGVSLVRNGDAKAGAMLFQRMLQRNANSAEVHLVMGEAHEALGEYSDALQEFRLALKLDPKLPETHYYTGMVLFKQGKMEDATGEFEQELTVNAGYIPALYQLGTLKLVQHQTDEAIRLLTQTLALKPSYADAHYQLGRALLEKGEVREAIKELETAVSLQPSADYSYYQLGLAYQRDARAGDAQRAMQTYQRLKEERQAKTKPRLKPQT